MSIIRLVFRFIICKVALAFYAWAEDARARYSWDYGYFPKGTFGHAFAAVELASSELYKAIGDAILNGVIDND